MNRLAFEKSPYLLQHKDNPVDWYPWGKEAFNKAKEENKPLFISIGYSTCHWCHVMNRESFQDEEVAELLNRYFVPIKVDREERPDIDKVYMIFAEAMIGFGGWPLNVVATPDGKPFFIGTYFPKRTRDRMIGLLDLLNRVNNLWESKRNEIVTEASEIVEEVKKQYLTGRKGKIDSDIFITAKEELKRIYDRKNGGFGFKPKFPMPQYIWYLLEYGARNDDKEALEMAELTLEKMYKGGIFDHIGYGFYRYSVDEKWLIPHFEKMLYDNALLGIVYAKAYNLTGKGFYKDVAEKIYSFAVRELLSQDGGFYSALDAESEGTEGKYYVFTYDEIIEILGKYLGEVYCKYYNITKKGNFSGANNPNLIGVNLEEIFSDDIEKLEKAREILFEYRGRRIKPHRDEKILTSWNGLIIGSLANAGRVFRNDDYIQMAVKSADFIVSNLIDSNGNLMSTFIDGKAYNFGFLEDYAFLLYGLLELYESCKDNKYLDLSISLADKMINLFEDKDDGGLYFYSDLSEELILRPKDFRDGATPSGNSMATIGLLKLFKITQDVKYRDLAEKIIYSWGQDINDYPLDYLYLLIAAHEFLTP